MAKKSINKSEIAITVDEQKETMETNLKNYLELLIKPLNSLFESLIIRIEQKFDKIADILESKVYNLEEENDKVNKKIQLLQDINNKLQSQLDSIKINYIKQQESQINTSWTLKGIKIEDIQDNDSSTVVTNFFKKQLNIDNVKIAKSNLAKPVNKEGVSPMIHFTLENEVDNFEIYKNKKALKDTGLYLDQKHAFPVRKAIRQLKLEAEEAKENGQMAFFNGKDLIIDSRAVKSI
jgi:hypothetical protein